MKKTALLLLTILLFNSCNSDNETEPEINTICDNTYSEFQTIFSNLIADSYINVVTMDHLTHEYTFKVSSQKEVCELGYQSYPEIEIKPYLIEIYDNTNSRLIYNDEHIFSSDSTSYAMPSETITLQPNISYTISRTQNNWNSNIVNVIGRMAYKTTMEFPYSVGDLTITSSNFHSGDFGSLPNNALPFIDIIFTE